MSVTLTLTPALVGAVVYLIGLIFLLGAGIVDEMSFVNPDYKSVVLIAVGWPIVVLYAIGIRVFN